MNYRDNIVVQSHAVIFVTTYLERPGLKLLTYDNAEGRAELYRQLYKEVYGYDMVEICLNFQRNEMIKKLTELLSEAKLFGKNHDEKTILALGVIHVGFKLINTNHKQILLKLLPPAIISKDGSSRMDSYILTHDGHVLNLPEFIELIARNPNVHVGLLEDFQPETSALP